MERGWAPSEGQKGMLGFPRVPGSDSGGRAARQGQATSAQDVEAGV